jgi:hypothetical protein
MLGVNLLADKNSSIVATMLFGLFLHCHDNAILALLALS